MSGGNGGRSQILTDSSAYQSRDIRQADDNLGVLKRYLGSLAANNERYGSGLSSKVYLSDIKYVLANPRFQRFFSSEAPKKKSKISFFRIIFYLLMFEVRRLLELAHVNTIITAPE